VTFREDFVEADGFRIRYLETGQGAPLVYLHGAGGLHLASAHALLARRFRVVAFEMPGFGRSVSELASTMAHATKHLGLDTFNLAGGSLAGTTALWLALTAPERVLALVLEAPAGIGHEADADLERRLPGLVTPTLVLCGTRDSVNAPARGRVYKALMPNCHLVFVYDAGPAISTDRPEAFVEVVADFLERREAFVISRARTEIYP
jgi:pimeloyl-ACP methyl ester carboxylesterase